jgi:hypothetical protein
MKLAVLLRLVPRLRMRGGLPSRSHMPPRRDP